MKHTIKFNHTIIHLFIAIVVLPILMTGCQSNSPEQIPVQTEPEIPSLVQSDAPISEPSDDNLPAIIIDYSDIAQDANLNVIPAVLPNANSPHWEILPEYQVLSLQGYPVSTHLMKPQIFVFPVAELESFNEVASQMAKDLSGLLSSKQIGEGMPFLPLFNAAQVMHTQVEFLDFQNGKGVRFLTQFDQAPIPINNYELIYTFQGLTNDGKYYIAAIFPVTHPDLPENEQVSMDQEFDPEKFASDMAESVDNLGKKSAAEFTPDLSLLDAVIRSIEVK